MSWNVNGIRAMQRKGFLTWLHAEQPDILCLQETKAWPEQLDAELRQPVGYHTYFASAENKGYSGVAIYSKHKPDAVRVGMGVPQYDREGRVLSADFGDFMLISTYVPSGSRDRSRIEYKLHFLDAFIAYCEGLRTAGKRVIFCGDINIAHQPIDLARPKPNKKTSGFLPEERAYVDWLLELGYLDTFRLLNPNAVDRYSWWAMRSGARERNVGWRLDYFFATDDLRERIVSAEIHPTIEGSDHCPVSLTLM